MRYRSCAALGLCLALPMRAQAPPTDADLLGELTALLNTPLDVSAS